jgi:hypothetical protein
MINCMAMCDDDEEDEIDELLDLRASLASCRYLDLRRHVRKNKAMNEMLWYYDDREFKQVVRMKKDSFLKLLWFPVFLFFLWYTVKFRRGGPSALLDAVTDGTVGELLAWSLIPQQAGSLPLLCYVSRAGHLPLLCYVQREPTQSPTER